MSTSTTNKEEKPKSLGDQILARAQAPKVPTVTAEDRKTGQQTVARPDLYTGTTGTKQADLALAKRQLATGQGIGDPNKERRQEYLKTVQGAGVKSRAFQEGLRGNTGDKAIKAAEARVAAERQYYDEQPKTPLTAGRRLPDGSRVTSARGQRPPPPTEADIKARMPERYVRQQDQSRELRREFEQRQQQQRQREAETQFFRTTIVGEPRSERPTTILGGGLQPEPQPPSRTIEVAPEDYDDANRALGRANQLVDFYNTNPDKPLPFRLTKEERDLFAEYGIENPEIGISKAKLESRARQRIQDRQIDQYKAELKEQGYSTIVSIDAEGNKTYTPVGRGKGAAGGVPGAQAGQSEKDWLDDLADQGYKVTGTSTVGGEKQYQFRNVQAEAKEVLKAYTEAGYINTDIDIGKNTNPQASPVAQYTKIKDGKEIKTVEINLPSGERREYTFESSGSLAKAQRDEEAFKGGVAKGFETTFTDLGRMAKFYTYDLAAEYVGSGGDAKKTQALLAKGPELNPSLLGGLVEAPLKGGVESYQGKGEFGDLAGRNLSDFGAEITDPRKREYYFGQVLGEAAFAAATLGIGPAVKAVQASGKSAPAIIKSGQEALRLAGVEGKVAEARPLVISRTAEGIIDEPLSKKFGIYIGRETIPGFNIGTKQAPKFTPTKSIKVPRIPNAFELVGKEGDTLGTFIPKTKEFIPAASKLTKAEMEAFTGQTILGPRSLRMGKVKSGLQAEREFQVGSEIGLDLATGGVRSAERLPGVTYARSATVVAQKPETVLPRIGKSGKMDKDLGLSAEDMVARYSQETPLRARATGGFIEDTGEVLAGGKRIKLGPNQYLEAEGGALRVTDKAPTYLTFGEKELSRGLKEQAKIIGKRKATRDALEEAQAQAWTGKAAKTGKGSSSPYASGLETVLEQEAKRSDLLDVTAARLAEPTASEDVAKSLAALSTGYAAQTAESVWSGDSAGYASLSTSEAAALSEPVEETAFVDQQPGGVDQAAVDAARAIDEEIARVTGEKKENIRKEKDRIAKIKKERVFDRNPRALRAKELELTFRVKELKQDKGKRGGITKEDAQAFREVGQIQQAKKKAREEQIFEKSGAGVVTSARPSGGQSLGLYGQTGYEQVSRKRQRTYDDYAYLRYPGEELSTRTKTRPATGLEDIAATLQGLSMTPVAPLRQRNVPGSGSRVRDGSRVWTDDFTGRGVGFDFVPRFDFDTRVDMGLRTGQRDLVSTFNIPGIPEMKIPGVPGPTTKIPPLPPAGFFGFDFDIPTGGSPGRRRARGKAYKVRDILELTLGSGPSAKKLPGYGFDDYTEALLEEYGR